MKTTVFAKFSACAWLIGSIFAGLVDRSLAQTGGPSNSIPIVTIRAPDPEASEPGTNGGRFQLNRAGPTNQTLNVFLRIGGTASNGVDYVFIPAWVSIPAGVREVPIAVQPLDDNLPEPVETVEAALVYPPTMPPINYAIGTPSNAVVFIYDNDAPPTNRPPWVTIVTPTNGAVFLAPIDIRLVAQAGDPDPGDYVATVEFLAGTNSLGVTTNNPMSGSPVNPFQLLWSNPRPGIYRLTAKATDNHGARSVSAPVEITVKLPPTNLPPLVSLTKPVDGQTFAAPTNVPLRAVTMDPDGYVPHIEFYAGTNLIGAQTRYFIVPPPPGQQIVYEMLWTNPPPGRYVLTAKAQDDRGTESFSAPVHIWVVRTNEPPITNSLPVVTITAPDATASEGTNCVRWDGWNCCPAPTNWCGTNTATFVIRRAGPTNDALTVCYRVDGTASNGVDYAYLPGMVTIPAGRRSAEIKLVPIDDLLPERLETVVLRLVVPPDTATALPPYLIGYPGRAAAIIVDNDAPRPATSVLPDHCFHFMRPAANGTCWRIDFSSNLVDWTPIGTTVVTDGAIHFVDPDADDASQRCYRAVPEATLPAEP
jgi:hypothetical protein